MPDSTIPTPDGPGVFPVLVNFGDEPGDWFKQITMAIHSAPSEIRVQFVGGREVAPFDILSLRNCLMDIPESVRLVTIAATSLPAFTVAAWLVGEERRIARDAVVWIPDLPEALLRHGSKAPIGSQFQASSEETDEEAEEETEDSLFSAPFRHRRLQQARKTNQGKLRLETDLRVLADIVNEWFPSWEFRGNALRFADLLEWKVVEPEWGFSGRRSRIGNPAPNSESAAAPE
jgi:hypothetical protein